MRPYLIQVHETTQRDLDPYSLEDDGEFEPVRCPYAAVLGELDYFIAHGELPKPTPVNWDSVRWNAARVQSEFAGRPFSPLIEGLDCD